MTFEILPITDFSRASVLLMDAHLPAGKAVELSGNSTRIDLNEYLTGGGDGVYLIRVSGDSMEAEIKSGDLLIVNRNLQARSGDVVIACVNGAFTVKKYKAANNGLCLVASNGKYKPRQITRRDDFEVFGVVTDVIHRLKKI